MNEKKIKLMAAESSEIENVGTVKKVKNRMELELEVGLEGNTLVADLDDRGSAENVVGADVKEEEEQESGGNEGGDGDTVMMQPSTSATPTAADEEGEDEHETAANTKGKEVAADEEGKFQGPTFTPRLYKQRYNVAIDTLRPYGKAIKKMADFGCAECRFLSRCRRGLPEVGHLVGVDIDKDMLKDCVEEMYPEDHMHDYYEQRRGVELVASMFAGDITTFDRRLADVDAITCIEVVEHLPEEQLKAFPESIFGQYRPRIAIVTTPNREFNVLFDMSGRQFRHWDHKFEWTRKEFETWCNDIVEKYPDYSVEIDGVGEAPEDKNYVGYCSQYAVFRMEATRVQKVVEEKKARLGDDSYPQSYDLLERIEYPWDNLFRHSNYINYHLGSVCNSLAYHSEEDTYEEDIRGYRKGLLIPLQHIVDDQRIQKVCNNTGDLAGFMAANGWEFGNGERIFVPTEDLPSTSEDDSEDETGRDVQKIETLEAGNCDENQEDSWKGGFSRYTASINNADSNNPQLWNTSTPSAPSHTDQD